MAQPTGTPTRTPSSTYTPVSAYGRTFSEEEWNRLPKEAQDLIYAIAMESALENTKTPQPSFPKTPSPVTTPTPVGVGKAVRHGRWVMDPDSNKKYYLGDPRYDAILKKLGVGASEFMGED